MDLQELSDRAEINEVLVRYTRAIDTGDWDRLDTVFDPVGVDELDLHRDGRSNSAAKKDALDSTCQRNTLRWCAVAEAFAGPVVESVGYRIEVGLTVDGEVCALR